MHIGRVKMIWIIVILLIAFIVFTECIAQVGGSADPVPRPPQSIQFEY